MRPARPYEDLVVVEMVSGRSGTALQLGAAMAGRILADLGARVIQVIRADEPPHEPGGQWSERNIALTRFLSTRKSVVRGNTEDRGFIARMLLGADVAIVDGHVHRLIGTGDQPAAVAVLSLFGGKHAGDDIGASEFTVSALGGLLHMIGDPGREPLKLGGHQEAYALGLAAFCGLAGVLADGGRAHRTMTVRASLLDAIVWLNWKSVPLGESTAAHPGRSGAAAEWQVLRCADGWVALVYQEPDWPRLCEMVGDERLLEARFATRQDRLGHTRELAGIVEERFLSRTRHQLHQEALAHRLPLGPVWSPAEAMEDPHNVGRGLFELLPSAATDDVLVSAPRLPVLWNGLALSTSTVHDPVGKAVGVS